MRLRYLTVYSEILSVFNADEKGKCKPYCEERTRDYFVEELEMRLVQESSTGKLSSDLPHFEVATSLGRPIEVDMRNIVGTVSVTLKHPTSPVRVENPEMRAVSGFVVELDNYVSPTSLELRVPVPSDDSFADLYVLLGDSWIKLDASRDGNKLVAKLKPADIERFFVRVDKKLVAMFAVISIVDAEKMADQFISLYDGGGKTAVIFVHGLTTNKVSIRKFVFEYESAKDDSKVYGFFYSPNKPLEELAKSFAEQASSRLLQD